MKDYYDIIGVPKNASKKVIEERYKFLTQAFHPDKFDDPAQKKKAEKDFAAIEEAYQVLSDDARRADYDRTTVIAESHADVQPQKPKNRTWLYVVGGVVVVLLMVGAGLLGRFLPLGDKNSGETAEHSCRQYRSLTLSGYCRPRDRRCETGRVPCNRIHLPARERATSGRNTHPLGLRITFRDPKMPS